MSAFNAPCTHFYPVHYCDFNRAIYKLAKRSVNRERTLGFLK